MFKTSSVPSRVGPIRSGIAAAPPLPQRHSHGCRGTIQGPQLHLHHRHASAVQPPCNSEKVDWRSYGDPVAFLLRLWWCYHGATISMAPQCCCQHRSQWPPNSAPMIAVALPSNRNCNSMGSPCPH